jgi:hypothetical protein
MNFYGLIADVYRQNNKLHTFSNIWNELSHLILTIILYCVSTHHSYFACNEIEKLIKWLKGMTAS